MVVLLPVVVCLVVIKLFDTVFFVFPTGVIGTVDFQERGGNAGPCLIRFFYISECLEADQGVVSVIGGGTEIRMHVGCRPVDISVALNIGVAGIEHKMVVQQSGSQLDRVFHSPERTSRKRIFGVRFQIRFLCLHSYGGTESGSSVGGCSGTSLYLYIIDGRGEVGHVRPKDGMRFGVVDRYAVDRDVNTVGICSADTEAGITDTCPCIRGHDDGRRL